MGQQRSKAKISPQEGHHFSLAIYKIPLKETAV